MEKIKFSTTKIKVKLSVYSPDIHVTCFADFTFFIRQGKSQISLQLFIHYYICAKGIHYNLVASVQCEVCLTFLPVTSTGYLTSYISVSSLIPYPLGYVWPKWQNVATKQVCLSNKIQLKCYIILILTVVANGLRDSMELFSVCTCHGMINSQDVFVHLTGLN